MTLGPSPMLGLLSLQKLFQGSKSEGLYPIFEAQDGIHYRIRLIGSAAVDLDPLEAFYGQKVQIIGQVDRLRGHWRLTLHTGDHGVSGVEVMPVDIQDGN
jgi:hypothetical protein